MYRCTPLSLSPVALWTLHGLRSLLNRGYAIRGFWERFKCGGYGADRRLWFCVSGSRGKRRKKRREEKGRMKEKGREGEGES